MNQEPPDKPVDRSKILNWTVLGIATQVGCLTLVIILGFMFLGLWIDNRFGTKPWWSMGLVLGSIPISIIAMLLVVRSATAKLKAKADADSKRAPEVKDFGDDD
ncbi:MAG TPA: AtpZ/AtpI family protein [Bellilinea sp.]|nr:AtpZ/AtpI family protein [Bellilinea sp.]